MKTYFEKLQDPRWQKKRLEVFNRDNFTCTQCGEKEKTLAVHHGYYTGGYDPWDYSIDTLHSVCTPCHERFESIKHDLHMEIGKLSISEMHHVFYHIIELQVKKRHGHSNEKTLSEINLTEEQQREAYNYCTINYPTPQELDSFLDSNFPHLNSLTRAEIQIFNKSI
jgi:hypothetical protein